MLHSETRIHVAGGSTLAGRALIDRLRERGYSRLLGAPPHEPELTSMERVESFYADHRPEVVIVASGASAGIDMNIHRPADLMLDNLLTSTHVIHQAYRHGVRKLLYLTSSCSYPKHAPQPLRPESLLTGPLEETNDAYALAKLAGWKLCESYSRQYGVSYFTAIPANLFGPGDDFSPEGGHVIPALLRRMHLAKSNGEPSVTIWGSGRPRRDFLYVRDFAEGCLHLLNHYKGHGPINIGSGEERTIAETAEMIAEVVGYSGRLIFDTGRPDGMPLKRLDSSEIHRLGWRASTEFRTALEETYAWFLAHHAEEVPDAATV